MRDDEAQPRFDREGSNAYWREVHSSRAVEDPLDAVCHPGALAWLNRYVARVQRRAFLDALAHCGAIAGTRVIEVGCGNGRWSRMLRDQGASVTANDLSDEAIARNRELIPGVDFRSGDFLTLDLGSASFDLGVTVTVVQHFPPDAQEAALARLSHLLRPGGHLLMLENIRDEGPHVFARSIDGWCDLFGRHGFSLAYRRGYEYDLPLRAAESILGRLAKTASRNPSPRPGTGPEDGSDATEPRPGAKPSAKARAAQVLIQGPAVALAYPMEPLSRLWLPDRLATHAAFVLRRS